LRRISLFFQGSGSALSARRIYLAIIVALALGTVGGMIALWPQGDAAPLTFAPVLRSENTYSGEIVSAENFECKRYRTARCQRVELEVTSGPDAGRREKQEVNLGPGSLEYSSGDGVVLLNEVPREALEKGADSEYLILDFDRKQPLLWLAIAFAGLVILFGRLRGGLSLVGLVASLLIVVFFVVPAILHDSPPLPVALVGSLAVMLTTIPLAHGFGPKSLAAMAGIAASLALIVVLAVIFADVAHLNGLTSEEASILAYNDTGLNLQNLLIAGMVIGSLGVLDDVTVSQASTVLALRAANPQLRFAELFRSAIDVGRDHVSATVNTLVLAYAGGSLSTLLILGSGDIAFLDAVNYEVIASVIVATLVGSIGLICAVPITTALSALLAERISAEELAADPHLGHSH
jgi:uncharacterized membrane protein